MHTNSGVPNHALRLIVDGGTYNGQTITGIGLTKAAHIYFRATSVYQDPTSDFADHADAIEQSAQDLIDSAENLNDLVTGAPSGQVSPPRTWPRSKRPCSRSRCGRRRPQCNFQPMLAQNPPERCTPGLTQVTVFSDDFETGSDGWSVSHDAVTAGLHRSRLGARQLLAGETAPAPPSSPSIRTSEPALLEETSRECCI